MSQFKQFFKLGKSSTSRLISYLLILGLIIVSSFFIGFKTYQFKINRDAQQIYQTYLFEKQLCEKIVGLLNKASIDQSAIERESVGILKQIQEKETLRKNPDIQYCLNHWVAFSIYEYEGGFHVTTSGQRYYEIMLLAPHSRYASKIYADIINETLNWNLIPYEIGQGPNDFGSVLTTLAIGIQLYGKNNPEMIRCKQVILTRLSEKETQIRAHNKDTQVTNETDALNYIKYAQIFIRQLFIKS